ncbi:hypothetical protein DFH11DRAFT_1768738 [Phellopilus nigrolimitatus]|nr:hypothetical protein DFH11DRAFT_1768738 [Phellopilus nigrolimitatus]
MTVNANGPMAPQQYVPAGGGGGKVYAPAATQAPLESSTTFRTQKRSSSSRVLEDYTLGKMLGAAAWAKSNWCITLSRGEAEAAAAAEQASKEASKETRTMREARC